MVSRMVWHMVYGWILPILMVRRRSHLDYINRGGYEPLDHLDRGHPGLSMHLFDRTGLPTLRVQFSIDLIYHLNRLG